VPSFKETIEVDADADATWEVLGDLTSVQHWIPGVVEVELTNDGRICKFGDGRSQHETISDYSVESRSFRYAILDAPGVRDSRGSFTIEAREVSSRVIWESGFEPLDEEAAAERTRMWEMGATMILSNLKRVIEESVG
jgi:hypothetical protein